MKISYEEMKFGRQEITTKLECRFHLQRAWSSIPSTTWPLIYPLGIVLVRPNTAGETKEKNVLKNRNDKIWTQMHVQRGKIYELRGEVTAS